MPLEGDYFVPPLPSRPENAPVPRKRVTAGWNPLSSRYRYKARPTYLMRLHTSVPAALRPEMEAMVLEVPNTDITVASGTTTRTNPRKREIIVTVASTSPCDPVAWWGCAGPRRTTWELGRASGGERVCKYV